MWETPFDPSMLDGNVLILCPNKGLVQELMELLEEYGVKWDLSERPLSCGDNFWSARKEKTCYRICNKRMGYSGVDYYNKDVHYCNYTKSTFFGSNAPDIEPASNDELMAFLGIGGV